jgi:hypothetical protein
MSFRSSSSFFNVEFHMIFILSSYLIKSAQKNILALEINASLRSISRLKKDIFCRFDTQDRNFEDDNRTRGQIFESFTIYLFDRIVLK